MAASSPDPELTAATPASTLPPLPAWPSSNLTIFGSKQWTVLGTTLAQLHADHTIILDVLGQFATSLETLLMSTLADLNTQLDAIKASETADTASLAALGASLATIITDLQNLPPVGVLTQADLDAVVQKATDDATAAAANAATGASESATATAGTPAAPTPPTP